MILGSGLGNVADRAEILAEAQCRDFQELPHPKVEGHTGSLALVRISGVPVLLVKGRVHLYEGYAAGEVAATVRFLAGQGIRHLVLTNAAGCINETLSPGNWMMITDHLNLTGTSPLIGAPRFADMSEIYTAPLRDRFAKAAEELGIALHQGVYAGVLGPQYETPAEIRMLARLGADAVGMSTVIEAIQARALGMEVAAFCCLTNWAAGLSTALLRHEDVLENSTRAAASFAQLLEQALVPADDSSARSSDVEN